MSQTVVVFEGKLKVTADDQGMHFVLDVGQMPLDFQRLLKKK